MSRALLNLVTNAVRHTREGDRVQLACHCASAWAQLEVANSGDGIRPDDLAHVFAPWYRVGPRDDSIGGLGLVIVREVARAHGGDVDVWSQEGAGTTFTIRLPLALEAPRPVRSDFQAADTAALRQPGTEGADHAPGGTHIPS